MNRIKYIKREEQVTGKVIEYKSSRYVLVNYGKNEFDNYTDETCYELTAEEEADVITRKDLSSRIRRIHYHCKEADYISEEVVSNLNVNDEDIEDVLKKMSLY